eukprot:1066004-Pyramimonas_sp.AAC.2
MAWLGALLGLGGALDWLDLLALWLDHDLCKRSCHDERVVLRLLGALPPFQSVASVSTIASLAGDSGHDLLSRLDHRKLLGHVAAALDCATMRAL